MRVNRKRMYVLVLNVVLFLKQLPRADTIGEKEECRLTNQRKAVCVKPSCLSRNIARRRIDCNASGNFSNVCCDVPEAELQTDVAQQRTQLIETSLVDESEVMKESLPSSQERSSVSEDSGRRVADKIVNTVSGSGGTTEQHRTEWSFNDYIRHGNWWKLQYPGKKSVFPRKRPPWLRNEKTGNKFLVSSGKDPYNTKKMERPNQKYPRYQWLQLPGRTPFQSNSMHWNHKCCNDKSQENKKSLKHDRRTTEKPSTSTTGFVQPSSMRPNLKPSHLESQQTKSPSKNRSISEIKCEEYSRSVTDTIVGIPLLVDPSPIKISIGKCVLAQGLIVGGEKTIIGEFPHMVAVGFRDRNKSGIGWYCGGTLISDRYVLTAAHCISRSFATPVKVRCGDYNLKEDNDRALHEDYAIEEIIKHPDYKPALKYNDIALVKLSTRVRFKNNIRPACLYQKPNVSRAKAVAIGWGRLNQSGNTSDILMKTSLTIVDRDTCNRAYMADIKSNRLPLGIIDSQICAGEPTGGKDTCQGDSGGPLEITSSYNRCVHYVIGITSFGKGCGFANLPGVYTRISSYVPWIENIVWPQ